MDDSYCLLPERISEQFSEIDSDIVMDLAAASPEYTELKALMAAAGSLAVTGAGAAALAVSFPDGASGGRQFVEFHPLAPPYSTSVTWSR